MMCKRWMAVVVAGVLVAVMMIGASAQPAVGTIRVLVVDGTKTFAATMRVAGLVGALRQIPIFEVGVVLSTAHSDWDDPLAGQVNKESPYDVVVVLPRSLDAGSAEAIWIVSRGFGAMEEDVRPAIGVVIEVTNRVFAGAGAAKTVNDDLFPALLWGLYVSKGWMR